MFHDRSNVNTLLASPGLPALTVQLGPGRKDIYPRKLENASLDRRSLEWPPATPRKLTNIKMPDWGGEMIWINCHP
jgi:hypothetical protein